jgi:hypothetical protein
MINTRIGASLWIQSATLAPRRSSDIVPSRP